MFEVGLLLYGGAMLLLGVLIATVARRAPRQGLGVSADQAAAGIKAVVQPSHHVRVNVTGALEDAESTTYDPKRFGDTSRLGTH